MTKPDPKDDFSHAMTVAAIAGGMERKKRDVREWRLLRMDLDSDKQKRRLVVVTFEKVNSSHLHQSL